MTLANPMCPVARGVATPWSASTFAPSRAESESRTPARETDLDRWDNEGGSPNRVTWSEDGDMSIEAAEYHRKAAQHFRHAAEHHVKAAARYGASQHDRAAREADLAREQSHQAINHAADAARLHLRHFGER